MHMASAGGHGAGQQRPVVNGADDGMNGPPPSEARGRSETDSQLLALLDDLVRAEGRRQAAQALGGNDRTLVRAVASGRLSRRMRDALERRRLADLTATVGAQLRDYRLIAGEDRLDRRLERPRRPDVHQRRDGHEIGRQVIQLLLAEGRRHLVGEVAHLAPYPPNTT